nr:hypothetical protein [Candidatus Sigynarchaeota archaeon]
PVRDKAGSVVIIFDPDEKKHLYNNKMTWWAEHAKESDMAFYATFPGQNLIGPGIGRIELGGVVSIYPPKRIPDIWHYFSAEEHAFKKHEILLLAAIEFADEKFIPYVAEEPPSKILEQRASDRGKAIMHIPTWRLSNETIDRMRYIHVLRNKQVRTFARDYIFL